MHPRVWATSSDGLIQYISLTKNRLEEAVKVVQNTFFKSETLSVAVGLSKHSEAIDEFDDLVVGIAMDGVSIVAEERATRKIVGCGFNKINVKHSFAEGLFKQFKVAHPSGQAYMEVNAEIDRRVDAFNLLNTECYVETIITGVLPEFANKGIGGNLQQLSCQIIQELVNGENVKVPLSNKPLPLDPIPTAGLGYPTTVAARRFCLSCGFTHVAEIDVRKCLFKSQLLSPSVVSKIPPIAVMSKQFKKV